MSVTTESRSAFVTETDARLRIVATAIAPDDPRQSFAANVMVTVEIRRGIGDVITMTLCGPELLRMVHDSVYLAASGWRAPEAPALKR